MVKLTRIYTRGGDKGETQVLRLEAEIDAVSARLEALDPQHRPPPKPLRLPGDPSRHQRRTNPPTGLSNYLAGAVVAKQHCLVLKICDAGRKYIYDIKELSR